LGDLATWGNDESLASCLRKHSCVLKNLYETS
jgi:hypothetical protein